MVVAGPGDRIDGWWNHNGFIKGFENEPWSLRKDFEQVKKKEAPRKRTLHVSLDRADVVIDEMTGGSMERG